MSKLASPEGRKFGWGSVILWMLTVLLGWAVQYSPLIGRHNWMLDAISPSTKPIQAIPIFFIGGTIALCSALILAGFQSMILLLPAGKIGAWFLATFAGVSIGWFISIFFHYFPNAGLADIPGWSPGVEVDRAIVAAATIRTAAVAGAIQGLILGACQWLVLRNWSGRAWLWIFVTSIAWALGGAICWSLYSNAGEPYCQEFNCEDLPIEPGYFQAALIGWLVGGLVVGFITAFALRYLLRLKKESSQEAGSDLAPGG